MTINHLRIIIAGDASPDGDQEQTVLLSRQYITRLYHHCDYTRVACGLMAVLIWGS